MQSLVDQSAIRDLAAIYSIARDDHDIESLLDCFAPDGSFALGGDRIVGREALRAFYTANMERYTTSLHVTYTHLVQSDGAGNAAGIVTGRAELSLGETLMICAYRYADRYVSRNGRWMFGERVLRFMYAVPVDDMGRSFTSPMRLRWPGAEPSPADYPETLPTWTSFRETPAD